nr:MAG TPA: hypothetical protein [Caudoviricetes sp.]
MQKERQLTAGWHVRKVIFPLLRICCFRSSCRKE